LEQWRIEAEKAFREDALAKSRAVLKGVNGAVGNYL
jgi:hypothetical protein